MIPGNNPRNCGALYCNVFLTTNVEQGIRYIGTHKDLRGYIWFFGLC